MITEIIFDDGKSIKNDSSLVRTIHELYGKKDEYSSIFDKVEE